MNYTMYISYINLNFIFRLYISLNIDPYVPAERPGPDTRRGKTNIPSSPRPHGLQPLGIGAQGP